MTNLTYRENASQNVYDVRREFDNVLNRFLGGWPGGSREQSRGNLFPVAFAPPVDAFVDRDGKRFVANIALPGVDPKDVNISAQGNVLTVSGERKLSQERKEADLVYNETMYGSFERTVSLPEGVDTDRLAADYRDGVLEISAPISAAALPRRIEIKGGQRRQVAVAGVT
jgi:HSP20 family protein